MPRDHYIQDADGKSYRIIGSVRRGLAMQLVREKRDHMAQQLQKVILLAQVNENLVRQAARTLLAGGRRITKFTGVKSHQRKEKPIAHSERNAG